MIASKKAESVAKQLSTMSQWAAAGLMLRAARELHSKSDIETALKYIELSISSSMGSEAKALGVEVKTILREMQNRPAEESKPGSVFKFFNRSSEKAVGV